MKLTTTILFMMICLTAGAQIKDDRKIIVTYADTANKWLQAKHAFIREGFMIVDIPGDTVATYPRTFVNVGLVMANGIISGNTITLSGYYGFKQANLSGIDIMPSDKETIPIMYYKASMTWKILMNVASRLGAEITYSK